MAQGKATSEAVAGGDATATSKNDASGTGTTNLGSAQAITSVRALGAYGCGLRTWV